MRNFFWLLYLCMYIKMAIIFNFLNQDEIANFDCQIWKLQNSLKNNKE